VANDTDPPIRRSPRTGLPLIAKRPPEPSTRCAEAPPPALLAGIAQFNAGQFWHCHETLEALWRGEPDPIRSLYQGILLIGVGYYHLERGNERGAITKLEQGLARLAPFRPGCLGVDVNDLANAVERALAALRDPPAGNRPERPPPPQIRLLRGEAAAEK
jgi:uncharacterized protein